MQTIIPTRWDCLIVGAGPAGLTAAIYLGRFLRRVLVLHNGASRAALIPTSHNFPGFSQGISGIDLLTDLRRQASSYGAVIEEDEVTRIMQSGEGFHVGTATRGLEACSIILATGIVDTSPDIAGLRGSIFDGQVRYCPICDGYEAMDKKIVVIGSMEAAIRKAIFLRTYSSSVTVISPEEPSRTQTKALRDADIVLELAEIAEVRRERKMEIVTTDGKSFLFDILYPAMGCDIRSGLATALGAQADADGALKVDTYQQTTVAGLYAIGDVVSCLDQMSVGIGHAALAATAIHNKLPHNFRKLPHRTAMPPGPICTSG